MRPKELLELIKGGESSTVEFKRKFTSLIKIASEISAFANTKGGVVLFGVDDDGSIIGVESEKSEIDYINRACEFYLEPPITPKIEIIELFGKDVVAAIVEEIDEKPCRVVENPDDRKPVKKAYIRVGDRRVAASREMTKILEGQNPNSKPLRLSIGEKERRLFAYLENYERVSVKDFSRICNISKRRASQLLIRLTRAGALQIHSDESGDYFTLVDKIEY